MSENFIDSADALILHNNKIRHHYSSLLLLKGGISYSIDVRVVATRKFFE
jgi:hypothetical protein